MSLDLQLMRDVDGEFVREAAQVAAGALVAGVWQGVLLCAAMGLILKMVPKSTATVRFVVWAAVFCVCVAMPFLNLQGPGLAGMSGAVTASHLVFDIHFAYMAAALWTGAAAYRLGQLVLEGLHLRALWRGAVVIPEEALSGFELPVLMDGRKVELCTSEGVDRPSVIGFFAPRILLPAWLFPQLTRTELNHIVLHELEHLRRRDDWVNLFQKAGLVLLPLNPALFWIDRRLSTERELACDDGVLARTKTPRAYAASLASIAERRLDLRGQLRAGALALAATGLRQKQSELGQRIESILGRRSPVHRAVAGTLTAVLVVGVVGSTAVLVRTPQLVSFRPANGTQQALATSAKRVPETAAAVKKIKPERDAATEFKEVSFPLPMKSRALNVSARKTQPVRTKALIRKVRPLQLKAGVASEIAVAGPKQVLVLTSWEDAPVSRIVVQTPDGRFFIAPYAAVPTQAGWMLIQL